MNSSLSSESHGNHDKAKDRHFVTWSEEEDNLLREQVKIHGSERWSVIASRLNNKTGRQCRRRWNTYLSTPYKKGGWSPDEDRILFEAHQKFGNRWTEIAKIVQGRTDNAVKNRFNALCRKLEKRKSSSKENDKPTYITECSKGVALKRESSVITLDSTILYKKMRKQNLNLSEGKAPQSGEHSMITINTSGSLPGNVAIASRVQNGMPDSMLHPRAALSVLPCENSINQGQSASLCHSSPYHAFPAIKRPQQQGSKVQGTFLEKDDPRLSALTQQAELLSSLAQRRNGETSNQELENAWKAVDGIFSERKESDQLITEDQMKDQISCHQTTYISTSLLPNIGKCQNATSFPSKRRNMPSLPKLSEPCEKTSQESSDLSVGSSLDMDSDDMPKCNLIQTRSSDFMCENKSCQASSTDTEEMEKVSYTSKDGCSCSATVTHVSCETNEQNCEKHAPMSSSEYCSPIQVIPYLRSFVDGIPSPHFSDSERQFVLSVLDPDSGFSARDYRSPSQRTIPLCRTSLSERL